MSSYNFNNYSRGQNNNGTRRYESISALRVKTRGSSSRHLSRKKSAAGRSTIPCKTWCSKCESFLDDEEYFVESILPYVRCLTKFKKLQLRLLFQKTLHECMLQHEKVTNRKPYLPKYNSTKPLCVQDEDEIFYWGLIPYLKSLKPSIKLYARMCFFEHIDTVYNDVKEKCSSTQICNVKTNNKSICSSLSSDVSMCCSNMPMSSSNDRLSCSIDCPNKRLTKEQQLDLINNLLGKLKTINEHNQEKLIAPQYQSPRENFRAQRSKSSKEEVLKNKSSEKIETLYRGRSTTSSGSETLPTASEGKRKKKSAATYFFLNFKLKKKSKDKQQRIDKGSFEEHNISSNEINSRSSCPTSSSHSIDQPNTRKSSRLSGYLQKLKNKKHARRDHSHDNRSN